jgi:hypothetical protein
VKELRFELRAFTEQDLKRGRKSRRASRMSPGVVLWTLAVAAVVYAAGRPASPLPSPPRILEFIGQPGRLCYEIEGAERAEIDHGIGPVPFPAMPGKCIPVAAPDRTRTYTLRAFGPGGTTEASVSVTVVPPTSAPRIVSFLARPDRVSSEAAAGQVNLCYAVADATRAQIDGVGRVPLPAVQARCVPVAAPSQTTTYTLRAFGPGGAAEASVSVTVARPAPPPPPSGPRILSFLARPDHVPLGAALGRVNLCYGVAGAQGAQIDQGVGAVPVRAENCVAVAAPRQTTTYTLRAFGPGGTAEASASVTVVRRPPPPPLAPPTILSFLARPDRVSPGAEFAQVNLCYAVTGATGAQINRVGHVPLPAVQARCISVAAPSQTTTYTLRAFGPGGTAEASVSVTVVRPPPPSEPRILSFLARPENLSAGQTGRLCYGVAGAVRTRIDPGPGQVASVAQNCVSIRPTQSTQYALTATGPDGRSVSQSVVVRVTAPPPPR